MRAHLRIISGGGDTSRSPEHSPEPVPASLASRGVYEASTQINGMAVFYAKTSRGDILGPITVDGRFLDDENDVIAALDAALDICDPERPRLAMVGGSDTLDLIARALLTVCNPSSSRAPSPKRAS